MFASKKNDSSKSIPENITTIIAEHCSIDGSIECKDYVRIDGHVLGNVVNKEGGVILGKTGMVKGDIKAKELIVFGIVEGNIHVDNLSLKESGTILGNMELKNFTVENGAVYKGTVSMDSPISDSIPQNQKNKN